MQVTTGVYKKLKIIELSNEMLTMEGERGWRLKHLWPKFNALLWNYEREFGGGGG